MTAIISSAKTVTYNGKEFRVVSGDPTAGPWRPLEPVKGKAHRIIAKPLDGLPVARGTLFLSTVPPSVNSLFFNRRKGRGKTLAYRNWLAFANQELREQTPWHVPGKVIIKIRVGTNRGDVDNRIKATLDLLVSVGRIEDDKNVAYVSAEYDSGVFGTAISIVRAA